MPRKLKLKVKARPQLAASRKYDVKVVAARKIKSQSDIVVIFQHLDKEQAGRMLEWVMEQPVYPDSITADFFRACGVAEVTVDRELVPEDTIGANITVKYHVDGDGNPQPVSFEPVREVHNG